MFSVIKKQAKTIMWKNYKYIIVPALANMLSGMLTYLLVNMIITHYSWENFNYFIRILFIFIGFLLIFIIFPLTQVALFKTVLLLKERSNRIIYNTVAFTVQPNIMKKIFITNFIPRILYLIVQAYACTRFYYHLNYKSIAIIASILGMLVSYKLFASNYYIAICEEKPIRKSFLLMRNKLGQFLLFGFSFVGWFVLAAVIGLGLHILITGNLQYYSRSFLPYVDMFRPFGYGIGLLLMPYMYVTEFLLFDQLSEKLNKK